MGHFAAQHIADSLLVEEVYDLHHLIAVVIPLKCCLLYTSDIDALQEGSVLRIHSQLGHGGVALVVDPKHAALLQGVDVLGQVLIIL